MGKTKHTTHNHEQPLEDAEINSWKRKLLWSWLLTIPIIIIMLSERLFGFKIFEMPYDVIVILLLGFPVIFIFGWSTIKSGIRGLFTLYFTQ